MRNHTCITLSDTFLFVVDLVEIFLSEMHNHVKTQSANEGGPHGHDDMQQTNLTGLNQLYSLCGHRYLIITASVTVSSLL